MLSVSSPRPSLGRVATLACPVPHGAAPTPDGEWAGDPQRRPGPRPRSALGRLSLLSSAPSFFVPTYAAFLFLRAARALRPVLSASAGFSPPRFRSSGSQLLAWPSLRWGGRSVRKRLGGGSFQVSPRSTGLRTRRAIPEGSLLLESYSFLGFPSSLLKLLAS